MNQFKTVAGIAAFASVAAFGSVASAVNTTSNVVFIVDESGSMAGEQAFLQNIITDLDNGLAGAGVLNRSYGVVGFGGPNSGNPRTFGAAPALENAANTATNLSQLITSGGTEDGYEAINFALSAFSYDAGAAVNYVLVTDEDRDVTSGDTFASILASLTGSSILLNAIVNNPFSSDNFTSGEVLGVDDSGAAYAADGMGGFTTDTGATVGNGFGTTETDYVDLALQSGGAAWNLNLLRAGGLLADSFAASFLDIKVEEITTQPTNPIPLPAAAWLLLSGVASLGYMGARRKKAA